MTKHIFILFYILFFFTASAQQKDIHFSIRYSRSEIGKIVASKKADDINESYTISGNASVNLLVAKAVVKNTQHSIYESNLLQYGRAEEIKNGSVNRTTETRKNKSAYRITSLAGSESFQQNITFSVGKLYFYEPVGVKELYSEVWGKMITVSDNGNHSYTLNLPNGRTSTYGYENGELHSVQTETALGSLYFIRTGTILGNLAENQ